MNIRHRILPYFYKKRAANNRRPQARIPFLCCRGASDTNPPQQIRLIDKVSDKAESSRKNHNIHDQNCIAPTKCANTSNGANIIGENAHLVYNIFTSNLYKQTRPDLIANLITLLLFGFWQSGS